MAPRTRPGRRSIVEAMVRSASPVEIPVPPGAWLGLLGGGQLGRMFCMAAQSLGYKVAVLDPIADSPAGSIADRHIHADYLDRAGLARLASLAKAATTEFENVPAAALAYLSHSARVTPAAESVAIAQDRIREKTFLAQRGFDVVPFAVLSDAEIAASAEPKLTPGIVKSARMGYDGKGQIRVSTPAEAAAAYRKLGSVPCVLERFVDLACEVSVIVARTDGGDTVTWPVAENRHRDGILDVSIVPARVAGDVAERARAIASRVAKELDYRGVLCVELFVTRDGALLVNEIAPRPHNSGHYTIDACVTSQFEQQARVLGGLPLGDTRQHEPAVMLNLLGDVWFASADAPAPREPDWRSVLRHPQAKLHLYGKAEPRRGRKMGHVTCLAPTIAEAIEVASAIKRSLGIPDPDFAT
jgi:5-(carboxyamino)imidazole ribonucleotide synthase